MSRNFLIGCIAALAVLVSAGPALGGAAGGRANGNPIATTNVGSTDRSCVAGGRAFDRGHPRPQAGAKLSGGACALASGDTATHESWDYHQACTRAAVAPSSTGTKLRFDDCTGPFGFTSKTRPAADGLYLR